MHPVLKHLIDNDFRDLAGSRVDGQIALSDDLINLGLHELIAQLTAPAAPPQTAGAATAASPAPTGTATPDPKALLRKLDVEKVHYRTEVGRTVLEIACAIQK